MMLFLTLSLLLAGVLLDSPGLVVCAGLSILLDKAADLLTDSEPDPAEQCECVPGAC